MRLPVILIVLTMGLCLHGLFSPAANAQQPATDHSKSIQISSRSQSILATLDKTQDIPLLNSSSDIVGHYRPEFVQNDKKFRVSLQNGTNFLIDPMQFTILAGDQNRLLAYGDHFELCTFSKLKLKIYSVNGNPIKSFDTGLYWPFVLAMSDDGEIVAAAKKGYNGSDFVLRKYSKSGDFLWEKSIKPESPVRLVLSPNNQYSSLIQYNEINHSRNWLIFDDAGNQIYGDELEKPLSEMEFITDDKIVVYSGHKFHLYKVDAEVELISSNTLHGNPVGNHPVSASPDGQRFLITTSPAHGDGYLMQVYNSSDGKFIAENYYSGSPYWQAYRIARMPEPKKIELLSDEQVVVFSLD